MIVGLALIVGIAGLGVFLGGLLWCKVFDSGCGFFESLGRGAFLVFSLLAGAGIIYGAGWLAVGAVSFVLQEMERNNLHWFVRGCLSVLSIIAVVFAFFASCDVLKSLIE